MPVLMGQPHLDVRGSERQDREGLRRGEPVGGIEPAIVLGPTRHGQGPAVRIKVEVADLDDRPGRGRHRSAYTISPPAHADNRTGSAYTISPPAHADNRTGAPRPAGASRRLPRLYPSRH
ncbi:hypothetical protein I6A60_40640 [Frankia sp. AgB1.9]|uniref:hypothetical protein n=1 Tax=unclassified Frankia TaxID=2632575 RepID=UPI001932C73E|nr:MULTISPECIES: hypothetical protein [unclassified Frankia]MBL7486705.1 hypothetical protein [Frankia sp. AgW1.1]MBL7554087.1 hypothetical protein [Frankia sp. AgB1.9]MBL7618371.1 hypothetical protein [Frankia sp. AgB1.8]